MTEPFPSQFVDAATGRLKRAHTYREQFLHSGLPVLAEWAVVGLKVLLAAPLVAAVPGWLLTAGAGLYAAASTVFASACVQAAEKVGQQVRRGVAALTGGQRTCPRADTVSYDFSSWAGVSKRYREKEGKRQKRMPEVLAALAGLGGLNRVPPLTVVNQAGEVGELFLTPWDAAAVSDGGVESRVTVAFGAQLLANASQREVTAITAHEIAHIALGHGGRWLRDQNSFASAVSTMGLCFAAACGPVPAWIAGVAVVTGAAARQLARAISHRHVETAADRGALLMTGMGHASLSGLKKIKKGRGDDWGDDPAAAPGKTTLDLVREFMTATHPSYAARARDLTAFEARYPQYCATRRRVFARLFNGTAKPEDFPARCLTLEEKFMDIMASIAKPPFTG